MGDLVNLLELLEQHRDTLVVPAEGWPDEGFFSKIASLPLVHRVGQPLEELGGTGSASPELVPPPSKAGRADLGIDRRIFSSFGRAPNQDPPLVLLFGPAAKVRERRQSTPWDSRGAARGKAEPASWIETWTLLGEDREDEGYLARHLATVFQTWERFLRCEPPVAGDPGRVFEAGELRSWLATPEARFDRPLAMDDLLIAAFYDPDDVRFESAEWRRTLSSVAACARRRGSSLVPVRRREAAADLTGWISQFIESRLEES